MSLMIWHESLKETNPKDWEYMRQAEADEYAKAFLESMKKISEAQERLIATQRNRAALGYDG